MLQRQRGINLIVVAVGMAGVAALAMAALFSMRYERNLFAEGLNKLTGKSPAAASAPGAAALVAPAASPGNQLRRCIINGKTVFSDTECSERNATTKNIVVHETRGIEAPKVPKPDPASDGPQDLRAKMIEKATR